MSRPRRPRLISFIERQYRALGVPPILWQPRIGPVGMSKPIFLHEITDAGLEGIVAALVDDWSLRHARRLSARTQRSAA